MCKTITIIIGGAFMRFVILYTPCFVTDYNSSFIYYNKILLSNSYNNTGVLKKICVLYIYIIYIMYGRELICHEETNYIH